jgi:hypothetical protein
MAMNLNNNAVTTIAALLVLNAGLFVSNHSRIVRANTPEMQANAIHANAEACRAKAEARAAALQARLETRRMVRDAVRARVQRNVARAAVMAPSNQAQMHISVTDYVRCLVSTGVRTFTGSN